MTTAVGEATVGRTGLPGPRSGLFTTLKYLRDPFSAYREWFGRYGDPVLLPTMVGPTVATGNAEGAREVLSNDESHFAVFGTDVLSTTFGPNAVMVLEGSRHKRERKMLAPPFRASSIPAYAEVMRRAALRHTSRWQAGDRVRIQDVAKTISRDIIIRAIFGIEDRERFNALEAILVARGRAGVAPVLFIPALRWDLGGHGPWAAFKRATADLDRLIYEEIEAKRKASTKRQDVLSLLLAATYEDGSPLTDEAIRDELVGLTLAGYATNAIALSWAFYWLHRHPDVLERLRSELEGRMEGEASALTAIPYLTAVCKETLRHHPLIPEVHRRVKKSIRVAGFTVPEDYGVVVSIVGLHSDPRVFEEPQAFRPERFLNRQYGAFEYMPFGGGHRRCIGAAFAMFELQIVLASVLMRYELELETTDVRPKRQGLAIGPSNGVQMRVVGRRNAEASHE
jgi:cytochrome P450 family 110